MWTSFAESARKGFSDALEKTGEALEKTGDVITKAASNPNRASGNRRPPDMTAPRNLESMPADDAAAATRPNLGRQSPASVGSNDSSGGFSPVDIRARAAAALAKVQQREEQDSKTNNNNSSGFQFSQPSPVFQNIGQNFAKGWSNVVEGAKKGVAAAQEAVEKEQTRLELLLASRDQPHYFSRDLNLPLDVPALKDAEVVYVTDRIISMSHPALPSSNDSQISGERKLAAVCHLLEKRHGAGNVMIWNLSEVTTYHQLAAPVLERVGPVLAFSFPGSPAPPLGLWLQLLLSLEKWLQASKDNVAVVHCLTGKGRTSTVLAAFLCWMAEAGFEKTNMKSALEYIAQCKKMSVEVLTIPSQRRYAQYFTNMLEGIRPSQPPLVLKRIIMSEAPKFALGPPIRKKDGDGANPDKDDGTDQVGENKDRMGCAPYLQIFQSGQLLHTVAATLHFQQQPEALPFCQVADGSIAFHVDQVIQGDVLIRSRHLAHSTKQKVSMFRAAFHTGYAPPNVLRFTKPQLDGACNDPRFPEDFFVDLILEPCSTEQASEFYQKQQDELKQKEKEAAESDDKVEKDAVVSASTYDSMLHRDSRFWDVISEHLNATESKEEDPKKSRMGPTVGKRRVFTSSPKNNKGDGAEANEDASKGSPQAADPLQTFSIGGELDFLPEPQKKKEEKPKQPPKKDSLMEALMGALGDEHEDPARGTEEIVFEDPSDAAAHAPAPAPQPQPTIVALPPAPADGTAGGADTTKPAEAAAAAPAPSADAGAKPPPPEHQESAVTTESMKEMENLLTQDSADIDMDKLLEDADDDLNLDDFNLDDDDDELADLENFLKS